ncbi:MAG: hypothetical protein CR991_04660 [Proteobacteria bacterium]|nr:MAG: hypothetical protein CR991_04660 [Pseudomonadota bacterium]
MLLDEDAPPRQENQAGHTIRQEVKARVQHHNQSKVKTKWRFTTDEARINLKTLVNSVNTLVIP